MSCYYKCELSALPDKLCHRFYIFRREVAFWLHFGVTINFLRAIITIIKKLHLHVFRYENECVESIRAVALVSTNNRPFVSITIGRAPTDYARDAIFLFPV